MGPERFVACQTDRSPDQPRGRAQRGPTVPHLLTFYHIFPGPATPTACTQAHAYFQDKLLAPGVPSPPQESRLAQATPTQARRRAPAPSSHQGSGAACGPPQRTAATEGSNYQHHDVGYQRLQGIQGQRGTIDLATYCTILHRTDDHQDALEDQPGAIPTAT